ncbi:hypothetical protein [Paenibacillus sp. y28]|uniref:hypothetical protein n=1 Tax=Paenibacillus sp. y28 TaxID=3129110 RepID=UPI0030178D81
MKLRLIPVFVSVAITSLLLFGSWFVYDSYAMETPLLKQIQQQSGVEQAELEMNNDRIVVRLTLNKDANVREIYDAIQQQGTIVKKRSVELITKSDSSAELDSWWSRSLFAVAGAMETKQYDLIPQKLSELAESVPGLEAAAEMDAKYVYVRLTDGTHSKFVQLPRDSSKLGVWPNE